MDGTDKAAMADAAAQVAEGFASKALAFATQIKGLDLKARSVSLEIDGLRYESTKFAASRGLEIIPRITALLGAALTRAVATGEAGDDFDESVILAVADRAMRDGLLPLVLDLLSGMQCAKLRSTLQAGRILDGFDDHFAGEYPHLLKVCVFALAHNLRGFTFGGL